MSNVEKVNEYLNKAKIFYFLTTDGDKPKGRPFGFHMLIDGKVREKMPQIMGTYDKNGWTMGLFHLENGHAEIRGAMDLKEEFDV